MGSAHPSGASLTRDTPRSVAFARSRTRCAACIPKSSSHQARTLDVVAVEWACAALPMMLHRRTSERRDWLLQVAFDLDAAQSVCRVFSQRRREYVWPMALKCSVT